MIHFLQAMWVWVRGGFKLAPKDFIIMRYNLCNHCPERRKGWLRESCNVCSCTVSTGRHPFNKLAHPCEGCPLAKWSPLYGIEDCDD